MAISAGGSNRGIIADVNVVPLIDVLLVLLVIFMIIPHSQFGLKAEIPQAATPLPFSPRPEVVVVQVLADGSLRINQQPVSWENLQSRLEEIYKMRANRVVFIRGDGVVEFSQVAGVIDVMKGAGLGPVGLLTPGLEAGSLN
jgi:biopolymer transport protein TolR